MFADVYLPSRRTCAKVAQKNAFKIGGITRIACATAQTSDDRRVKVIVTGGNSGVGEATAAALAAAGHSVVIACRTIPKAEQAAAA